jgi:hypothetical protein
MALKAQISHGVYAADVPKKVPGEFRDLIKSGRLDSPIYTVVSFPGMRGHSTSIVDSKTLTKALNKFEATPEKVIVVAHDFTLEARTIMEEKGIIPIFKSDFGWTDERWAYIREKLGGTLSTCQFMILNLLK